MVMPACFGHWYGDSLCKRCIASVINHPRRPRDSYCKRIKESWDEYLRRKQSMPALKKHYFENGRSVCGHRTLKDSTQKKPYPENGWDPNRKRTCSLCLRVLRWRRERNDMESERTTTEN